MDEINHIQSVVQELLIEYTPEDLMEDLEVSRGTISNYLTGKTYPRLATAILLYKKFNIIVHPYSEQSIKLEIKNETTNY